MNEVLQSMRDEQYAYDAELGMETNEEQLAAQVEEFKARPDSWEVTEANLAKYRQEVVPYLELMQQPILAERYQSGAHDAVWVEMLAATQKYLDGEIALEACGLELNKFHEEALALRDTACSAAAEQTPLVVKGFGFDPYMIPAFMRDHPEIPLVIDNDFSIQRTQFISSIQSGDSSVDVYVLPDSWNVWSLIDKGFALDLSPFQAIRERIQAMNIQVQQAISHENRICALPIGMYVNGWSVRADLLKAAGYDHTPTTLLDFLTMQKEWDEEKGSEYDFAFVSNAYEGYRLRLYPYVEMAVSEYITQYETPDQPLSFDTPAFRQVLNAIEALGYQPENVDEAIAAVTDDHWLFECPEAIFNINDNNPFNVGESAAYHKTLISPLPFEENGVQRVTGLMYLAIVNPYSQHVENAIAF